MGFLLATLFAAEEIPNVWIAVISVVGSILGTGGVVKIVQILSKKGSNDQYYKELLKQERRANTRTRNRLEETESKLDDIQQKYENLLEKYLKLKAEKGEINEGSSDA